MKKVLIVLFVLFISAVPPVNPDGKDWRHTGAHEYTQQLTVQGETLSGIKIAQYDAVVTQMADSIQLSEAIQALPYILAPTLTTSQINALTPEEGTFVYDITLHVFKFYNGSTWKTVTTD